MSPSDTVVQLYPQAPAPLYVSFCDSLGYGGGIVTRLHEGKISHNSLKYYFKHSYETFLSTLRIRNLNGFKNKLLKSIHATYV
jgi:hypothetical protein